MPFRILLLDERVREARSKQNASSIGVKLMHTLNETFDLNALLIEVNCLHWSQAQDDWSEEGCKVSACRNPNYLLVRVARIPITSLEVSTCRNLNYLQVRACENPNNLQVRACKILIYLQVRACKNIYPNENSVMLSTAMKLQWKYLLHPMMNSYTALGNLVTDRLMFLYCSNSISTRVH